MTRGRPRYVLLGIAAGAVSSAFVLILPYVVGVVAIAVTLQDFFATLLAALTVLPLMLLLVLLPLTLLVGTTAGLLLGLCSRLRGRPFGVAAGAVVALVLTELIFSLALPLVMPPRPSGDFTTVVGSPYLSAAYGLALGSATGLLFRRLSRAE
jgi:hypothetical protein